ncbi:hypothetical protein [Xanthobacter autotrophicus]|uniref:hypothetical protein n=1 Tax=Xanthobacter autotrophicus TaxID=280 RepID=UPI0024A6C649|nr:hypothetical protein [Xanthobacter autotrophicus]MDI4655689.1 hypothetical protein [Xanthobacter autotrophicus]
MRKSILSLAILAGALAFTAAARADDSVTDANRESIRVARGVTADHDGGAQRALGYGNQAHTGGFAGTQQGSSGVSANDAFLFELGDRGLGHN